MLLDAETFDYTFHLKAGEGFKIAVHHHLDQPIMSIQELDLSPGSVFQVCRYVSDDSDKSDDSDDSGNSDESDESDDRLMTF